MNKRIFFTFFVSIGCILGEWLASFSTDDFDGDTSIPMIIAYIIAMFLMPNKEPKQ